MNLTKHFTLEEFLYSDTAKKNGIRNVPNEAEIDWMLYGAIHVLEYLRAKLNRAVVITSGFRNHELNKLVGGVPNSQHCLGQAVDIRATPDEQKIISDILRENIYVDQCVVERNKNVSWIHVSWGPRNRRQFLAIKK